MDEAKIRVVRDLIGQRCERVENPYGSVLSVDLGPLGVRLDDRPDTKAHGWRHLTVLSPWRLQTADFVVCDWNDEGGPAGRLGDLLGALVGERVSSAEATGPGWDLILHWSNGMSLMVFSDSTDHRDDAWFILGTDGVEVAAGPELHR